MDIQGLLGNPLFNIGAGLLAQSGPSTTPVSMGQAFGGALNYARDASVQANQLEAQRQALQQRKQQQSAMSGIAGLLNNNAPAGIQAPPQLQQQRMMGLLAQAFPEQFAQSALQAQFNPQRPNMPSSAEEFMFLQNLPPEQQQAYMDLINPADPSQVLADTLAAQQIQANLNEQEMTQQQRQQMQRRRLSGAKNSVETIGSIIDMMEEAEGTAAQPGGFASQIRGGASLVAAVQNLFGGNNGDPKKVAQTLETLDKKFSTLSSSNIPDAFLGSDSKLEFFSSQLPGTNLQVGTNLEMLDGYLKGIIEEDYIDDGEFNRESTEQARQLRARIQRLLSPPSPPPGFIED